jgi:hypothetical protein
MNHYHGEINTPVERHIDIYIAETCYSYAEWKECDAVSDLITELK